MAKKHTQKDSDLESLDEFGLPLEREEEAPEAIEKAAAVSTWKPTQSKQKKKPAKQVKKGMSDLPLFSNAVDSSFLKQFTQKKTADPEVDSLQAKLRETKKQLEVRSKLIQKKKQRT